MSTFSTVGHRYKGGNAIKARDTDESRDYDLQIITISLNHDMLEEMTQAAKFRLSLLDNEIERMFLVSSSRDGMLG